ncbi:MAG: enoyl-CoA hydratase-related protein [Acidobacteriota bacterium]
MPSILSERDGRVLRLTINRPEVRNAFDEDCIARLTAAAVAAGDDREIRAVVLAGAGPVFCAGADLGWMARAVSFSHRENLADAEDLARMLERLDTVPVPVVGRVQGAALGGGLGLAAVCDIVVAAEDAVFGLTEVKLGLLPAVVAPYVVRKIGVSAARELFLSGARFDAARAKSLGLVHEVVPAAELDAAIERRLAELRTSGPAAVAAAKALIRGIAGIDPKDVIGLTTATIAAQRVSKEGQEGMRAFMEKRKPDWTA